MRRPAPTISLSTEDRGVADCQSLLFDNGFPQLTRSGPVRPGLNFAVQDHLGLSSHPTVRAVAQESPAVGMIETRIATALRLSGAVTFATATDAIHQTLSTILTPDDQVLIDAAAPQAMFDAVCASRAGLHRFPTGSLDAVERRLSRLSRETRRGRLVIAVPAVSAQGSRIADMAELSALARLHAACLIVDVSHDFGTMGQDGGGVMELQACQGRADIVLGNFATSLGAAGGFAAFRNPDLGQALQREARPLSPHAALTINAATGIAFSPEGRRRRRLLHGISLRLRNHLMADDARILGQASPLVPILLPADSAVPRTALLESAGPRVTLLQAPAVPRHAPRWRVELSALHTPADIDDLAELIRDVTRAFDRAPVRQRVAV